MSAVPSIDPRAFAHWAERLASAGYEVAIDQDDPDYKVGVVRKDGKELRLGLPRYTDGHAGVYVTGKDSRRRAFVLSVVAALRETNL